MKALIRPLSFLRRALIQLPDRQSLCFLQSFYAQISLIDSLVL